MSHNRVQNGRNGVHGLDGFLVVARCYKDDIPLGLFATLHEAQEFAATLTMKAIDEAGRRLEWDGMLQGEATFTLYSVAIVHFAGGVPVKWGVALEPDDVPWGYPEGYVR
jgi:hypothetical protein